MSTVLTTIVLHFEDGSSLSDGSSCQAEPDETRNKNSDGTEKTTFLPGEDFYFLVKCTGKVRVKKIAPTHGTVFSLGAVSRTRKGDALFVELNSTDNKPGLSYPPDGSVSIKWIGNVGGTVYTDRDAMKMDIKSGTVPCFGEVSYPVNFNSYKLASSALPLDEYQIYIVVYLENIV